MNKILYNVIFVLGRPGTGKGTQCKYISNKFGYVHLSAGDLLRAEMKKEKSPYRSLIDRHIVAGTIVPVEITCNLIKIAMEEGYTKNQSINFLIDGFPRNKDNIEGWTKVMSDVALLKLVLLLECEEQECIRRCLGRNVGRTDDNMVSLKKRMDVYEETVAILKYFSQYDLIQRVDTNRKLSQVHRDIDVIIQKL